MHYLFSYCIRNRNCSEVIDLSSIRNDRNVLQHFSAQETQWPNTDTAQAKAGSSEAEACEECFIYWVERIAFGHIYQTIKRAWRGPNFSLKFVSKVGWTQAHNSLQHREPGFCIKSKMLLLLISLPVGSRKGFYRMDMVEKLTDKNHANDGKDSRNRAGTGLRTW